MQLLPVQFEKYSLQIPIQLNFSNIIKILASTFALLDVIVVVDLHVERYRDINVLQTPSDRHNVHWLHEFNLSRLATHDLCNQILALISSTICSTDVGSKESSLAVGVQLSQFFNV